MVTLATFSTLRQLNANELAEAIKQERIRSEEAKFEWERGWLAAFPELMPLLKAGISRTLLFRLFVQRWQNVGKYWERLECGRNDPGSSGALLHQERSLIIHALSVGWDEDCDSWDQCDQCQALLQVFWKWNGNPRCIEDDGTLAACLRIPIAEALDFTSKMRHDWAARRRLAEIARIQNDPVWRIQTFLLTQDKPSSLAKIAEGTGLKYMAAAQAIGRDKLARVTKVARGRYSLGKAPVPLPEPLGLYVSPAAAQWQREREDMAAWRAQRKAEEAREEAEWREEMRRMTEEMRGSIPVQD